MIPQYVNKQVRQTYSCATPPDPSGQIKKPPTPSALSCLIDGNNISSTKHISIIETIY